MMDILTRNCLLLLMMVGMLEGCIFTTEEQPSIVTSDRTEQPSISDRSCLDHPRPLNPDAGPQPSETELDRYFRLAFDRETAGEFDEAITYYQKAAELATCACDRQHALAGKQAAEEAKDLFIKQGMASKPTQFFWVRLQELTQSLPCVQLIEE